MKFSSNKTNKTNIIDENTNNLNNNSQIINKKKSHNNNHIIYSQKKNLSSSGISKEKLQNLKYIFPFLNEGINNLEKEDKPKNYSKSE